MHERSHSGMSPATALAAMLATATAVHAGTGSTTIYVDAAAAPGGHGGSWQAAFRDLQDALDQVNELYSGAVEVRIAGGVYKPGRGTLNRTASFDIHPHAFTSAVALTLPNDVIGSLAAAKSLAAVRQSRNVN